MKRHIFALSLISLACASTAFSATPIVLQKQSAGFLQTVKDVKETSRHIDFNHTTHIRIQQMYAGHPVWGADAVVHVPHNNHAALNHLGSDTSMNGTVYQGLDQDLRGTPAYALTDAQANKAFQHGVLLYQKKSGMMKYDATKAKKTLIVYIDKNNKAHWAYLISFLSGQKDGMPAVPTFILDAVTFAVYAEWNDLQTLEDVSAGGYGGNLKMGKLTYDGGPGHYPALDISRNSKKMRCTLETDDVTVKDDTNASGPFSNAPIAKFNCAAKDPAHANLYWDGEQDAINGAYSPVNDSMYIGKVINDMYQKWYGVPPLTFFGMPWPVNLHAHAKDMFGKPMDNAFFFPLTMEMYFGDGVKMFYPLTSLGVGAHEISHGFTSAHSNLTYEKQSGGLNESYSDMAAQAAEFYSTGTNNWQIGPEIVKGNGALRYMDDPTKDGKSIDNVKDYTDDLNVHYSSGVFNKVFYLLGTTTGWDTRKAFNVMVKANMDYWTKDSTFADAACGVVKATRDYKYNVTSVTDALQKVGIDATHC